MVIRYYEKTSLAIKGEFAKFISAQQTKYINAIGTFEITTDYLPENIALGDIIFTAGAECKSYCGEITQIEGSLTADGEKYTIKGRDIVGLLSERIPIVEGQVLGASSMKRETVIKQLANLTFLASGEEARNVSQICIAADQERGAEIAFTADPQKDVLENMYDAAESVSWGIDLQPDFANGKYVLDIIVPDELSDKVVLSPKFDNLINEAFVLSRASYKNTAYYSWTENDITTYDCITLNAGSGFNRRERWISASTGDGVTEAGAAAIIQMQLGNYKEIESYSGDYQASQTFTFGADFDVGDIISYAGKMGVAEAQVIGYTQTHESGVYTLQLLLGDNVASVVRNIQKVERNN